MHSQQSRSINTIHSHTQNIHDANHCLDFIIGPHNLIETNILDTLDFSFQGSQIGRMIIGDLTYGKDIIFKTHDHHDMNHFCITRPKTGRPVFKMDGAIFYACHDQASIVSPDNKFELEIDKNCVQTFISFSKNFVEKILSDVISQPITKPLIFENIMNTQNPKIKAWWDLIDSIRNFTHNFTNASFFGEMRSDFEYIIVKSLLLSQPNNYSDLIYKNNLDYPDFLKQILEFIQNNIHEKIDISDLEYASGMNKKKLNTIFKKYLKCSSNAYIRHYRLKCIYDEISQSTHKINITEIAYKWGVTHLGRFSIEYKDAFGEKPSQTLKKIMDRQFNPSLIIQ